MSGAPDRDDASFVETVLRNLADLLGVAVYAAEPEGRGVLALDDALRELHGIPRDAALDDPGVLLEVVHPDDGPVVREALRRRSRGEATDVTYRVTLPDGATRWIRNASATVEGPDGPRTLGVAEDVTERRRREEAASFLAEASLLFSSALDPREVVARLTHLAIPRIGDWCRVHLVDEDGGVEAGEPAHRDPAQVGLLRELERRYPPHPDRGEGVCRVLGTGRAEVYPEITDALLESVSQDGEHLALARRLGLRSAMIVPLRARGRVLGAISFAYAESGRRYGEDDVGTAMDLAERAALALEDARLHRESRLARRRAEAERSRALELLERIPDGFMTLDRAWRCTFLNAAARAAFARRGLDVIEGKVLWDLAPEMVGTHFEATARGVMESRDPDSLETYYPHLDRWYLSRMYPTSEGIAVVYHDVTARRRDEAGRKLLDDVGVLLGSSVDYGATLSGVAGLAVPQLADLAVVYLLAPEGGLEPVGRAARDTELAKLLDGFLAGYRPGDNPGSPSLEVLASGEPLLLQRLSAEQLERWGRGDGSLKAVQRALAGGSYLTVPLTARTHPLGVLVLVRLSGSAPFVDDEVTLVRELARRAAVAVDNARLFRETERARRSAEAASRAKSDFLAVMSHELRTPLNAIVGYGELIESEVAGPVGEQQLRYLGRIRESAWHLLSLIEEILSLSRIEAGQEDVSLASLDAVALAEDAAAFVEPLGRKKGLAVEVRSPDGPVPLETDEGKVRQILLNILSNAVKFTAKGSVRLTVEDGGDGEVAFLVADTGPGIDPGEHETIFEPFRRGQGGVGERSGTGLGLSVSRRLARLLGGDVLLDSEPGRGSLFTLRLPRHADASAAGRDHTPDDGGSAHG